MAADASTGLGAAIGLQGVPKDYGMQFANLGLRQQGLDNKAKAAERKAAEKDYKMFELKPGAMLRGREEPAKNRLGIFYKEMSDVAKNRESPRNNPAIQQSHAENLSYLDASAKERADFYEDLALLKSNPEKYKINEEVYNEYASGNAFGETQPFYQKGALLIVNGNPEDDLLKKGAAIGQKLVVNEVIDAAGNQVKTMSELTPEQANKDFAERYYGAAINGNNVNAQVLLDRVRKEVAQSPLADLFTEQETEEAVKNKFVEYSKKQLMLAQDTKNEKTITPPSKGTTINVGMGTSGDQLKGKGTGEFFVPAYTVGGDGKTIADPSRNFVIKQINPGYVISLKKGELILPASPNIIDLQTLKPAATSGNLEITGGNHGTVPVYKKGTNGIGVNNERFDISGLPVPQELLEQAKKDTLVEYKLKFIGNGVDNEGSVHQIMFDVDQPITDAATLKEAAKDQPKVAQGIDSGKKTAKKLNAPAKKISYKQTKEFAGSTYGRNSEKESWKKIK